MHETRGWMMPRRRWFPLDGRLHRAWFWLSDAPVLWRFPGLWRPLCWINGAHDQHYGRCVICGTYRGEKP